jgi:uncharacterized protein YcaQ
MALNFATPFLRELRDRGPLRTGDFVDTTKVPWESGGWSSRDAASPICWIISGPQGTIMVARRKGLERWWDLAERVHPTWAPSRRVGTPARDHLRRRAEIAHRALGVGRPRDIERHFIERRYRQTRA